MAEAGGFRFLLDEMIHFSACRELRRRGTDALHVREVRPLPSGDLEILEHARRTGRILVTRDYQDFSRLAEAYASRGVSYPGILLVPPSLPHSDVGSHVHRIEAWASRHRDEGNPVRDTYGWL